MYLRTWYSFGKFEKNAVDPWVQIYFLTKFVAPCIRKGWVVFNCDIEFEGFCTALLTYQESLWVRLRVYYIFEAKGIIARSRGEHDLPWSEGSPPDLESEFNRQITEQPELRRWPSDNYVRFRDRHTAHF